MRNLSDLKRRMVFWNALAGAILLALAAPVQQARGEDSLNVVSWDGAYLRSQILGFIRPYEEATGKRVDIIQYDGGIDELRQQVRSWNVTWDVVDLELFDAIRACNEGLLEPLDAQGLPAAPDGTPASEDFIELDPAGCGVGNVVSATAIGYRADRFKRPPGALEDFFDLASYPGRRGLRRSPMGNLEWAIIADGVAPEDVYKVLSTEDGLERAFAVLDRIKPFIDWWRSGHEAIRFLETDSVAMTSVYSGRIAVAVERGEPFDLLWDHQLWYYDVWGIPKNGRNTELARDFVRFATSTESLAAQAAYIPYGPMRSSSMKLLSPAQREQLPTAGAHLASAIALDAAWWSENLDRIAPRFERWVARPVMVPKSMPR